MPHQEVRRAFLPRPQCGIAPLHCIGEHRHILCQTPPSVPVCNVAKFPCVTRRGTVPQMVVAEAKVAILRHAAEQRIVPGDVLGHAVHDMEQPAHPAFRTVYTPGKGVYTVRGRNAHLFIQNTHSILSLSCVHLR